MGRKHIAIILAAGMGARAGFTRPKQFVKLAGMPVVAHAIKRFQAHPAIDEICIVSSADYVEELERIALGLTASKVKKVLVGGAERRDSSLAAIKAYEAEARDGPLYLIFHDAVRPLVSSEIIDRVIAALDRYNAVDVAIPTADTVIAVDPITNQIASIPDRRRLRLGQTPQAFLYETIAEAYKAAEHDDASSHTDDCGVVLRHLPQERICVVPGDTHNHKLTYPTDLLILEKLVQSSGGKRRAPTAASHQLAELRGRSIVVFGGTSGIGQKMAELAVRFGANVAVASRRVGVDIAEAASVKQFLAEVAENSGRIDAVVNCAGSLHYQPLATMEEADLAEAVGTNYVGAINVARASFPYLRETRGHLLLFTSSSYTMGRAHYSIYSSSKAAIVNLSQALADEWASSEVKVNCINPDRTATPMRTQAFGAEPIDQLLTPEVVALDALSVLAGQESGYIYDIERR